MTLRQIFGKNVKYYRFQKNLTQEQLAEKVNLDFVHIGKLERGLYGPTFDNIENIAKALDVKPNILFEETENTHKKLPNRVDMK